MDRNILVTYVKNKQHTFDWLQNEDEVKEWLEENEDTCKEIEIIKINVLEVIYRSQDY